MKTVDISDLDAVERAVNDLETPTRSYAQALLAEVRRLRTERAMNRDDKIDIVAALLFDEWRQEWTPQKPFNHAREAEEARYAAHEAVNRAEDAVEHIEQERQQRAIDEASGEVVDG